MKHSESILTTGTTWPCSKIRVPPNSESGSRSKGGRPFVVKAYKRASDLFLTRRLPEALCTLNTLICLSRASDGQWSGIADSTILSAYNSSRRMRIKVWNLYLSILNGIVELGYENGQRAFGVKEWKTLATKVWDGTIWEDVVQIGYNGREGNVDPDVVLNLATLLLSHSTSQRINQQKIEAYLAATNRATVMEPDHLISISHEDINISGQTSHISYTDTPRSLECYIKILELYTLHVLPRISEWKYAKDFINMSEMLDEDRREYFLQILQDLEEHEIIGRKGAPCESQGHDTQLDNPIRMKEKLTCHRISDSAKDYGIDEQSSVQFQNMNPDTNHTKAARPPRPFQGKPIPVRSAHGRVRKEETAWPYRQITTMLEVSQGLVQKLALSMSINSMTLLRTIFFLVALITAISRHDVRVNLVKMRTLGWDRLRSTLGAGVKVSYL